MKLLKSYFLLVARRPVAYTFWAVVVIYIIARIGIELHFDYNEAKEREMASGIKILLSVGLTMIFVVISLINNYVVWKNITVLKLEHNEMGILISNAQILEIYEGPVWGKFSSKIIRFPEKWNWKVQKGDFREIEVLIKIEVTDVIHLTIPILIRFVFSGPFILSDLGNFLKANLYDSQAHSVFNISKAIKKIVFDLNAGVNHDLIKQDSLSYLSAEVTEEKLISDIKERIQFPEKLFINVERTPIELGAPKFNFGKAW